MKRRFLEWLAGLSQEPTNRHCTKCGYRTFFGNKEPVYDASTGEITTYYWQESCPQGHWGRTFETTDD